MSQSSRKLTGTMLLLLLLAGYPLLAMQIYATWLTGAPWWVIIAYSSIAGLGWALPAGVIIRWMAKP